MVGFQQHESVIPCLIHQNTNGFDVFTFLYTNSVCQGLFSATLVCQIQFKPFSRQPTLGSCVLNFFVKCLVAYVPFVVCVCFLIVTLLEQQTNVITLITRQQQLLRNRCSCITVHSFPRWFSVRKNERATSCCTSCCLSRSSRSAYIRAPILTPLRSPSSTS